MGVFKSTKTFQAPPALIPVIAQNISVTFSNEGYQVQSDSLLSGGYDISITKGGLFKAILGMKTALKIVILPQENNILINAGVGIFGQQAVPTVISMFFLWPVLITQLSGMISQSRLDDRVMEIANDTIAREAFRKETHSMKSEVKFCTQCGKQNASDAKFCCQCGVGCDG